MTRSLKETVGQHSTGFDLVRAEIVRLTQIHPLVWRLYRGDRGALEAYLQIFWPFVHTFEHIIDERSIHYGRLIARAVNDRGLFRETVVHLRKMREEEGQHAGLWATSAASVGITLDDSYAVEPEVERLITKMREASPETLFVSLWTTEVIANAISEKAMQSPALADFDREWFRVHTELEDPSHEDIDRWLACCFLGDKVHEHFREKALETWGAFAAVANFALSKKGRSV